MSQTPLSVLFLCTGNSARSIIAEALLNAHGGGRFVAYSAGSHPVGKVNPLVVETLQQVGIKTDNLSSKNWKTFARPSAPDLDVVITVCDNAAGETCPIWYSSPVQLHWGFEDPVMELGSEAERRAKMRVAFSQIDLQIRKFISLPMETFVQQNLKAELQSIAPN